MFPSFDEGGPNEAGGCDQEDGDSGVGVATGI